MGVLAFDDRSRGASAKLGKRRDLQAAMKRRTRRLRTARQTAIGAALIAGAVLAAGGAAAALVTLVETGSTLFYPLFSAWVRDYQQIRPDVRIVPHGTGSGAGMSQAASGAAQIGASDAYMSDEQMRLSPGVLNIALAISAQMVNYNLPGLSGKHLKLSGPVLAAIYRGDVRYWDDPAITGLNPGTGLPHHEIIPIHRTDGSGDTFMFTQYLSFSTSGWANSLGYGTTMDWPARNGVGAEGNSGVIGAARRAPYSIAYVGVSFKGETVTAGLGEAALENRDGNFVLPDAATITAAVHATAAKTPADQRISLIFAPGAQSYPIINYEYAMVRAAQASPDVAAALRNFLTWAISPQGGSTTLYMQAVGFVPLPPPITALSQKQIDAIH